MSRRFLVIGAGPGGICAAHRLKQAGFDDVVIVEKNDGVGGTWWRNRYPGLACDVPSHFYSYSFAPKADWSRPFAPQAEIQAYLEQCVDDFGLRPHLRLGTAVPRPCWDETDACWRVTTDRGEELVADVLISSAQGMFGEARLPDIEGRDRFAGTSFHRGSHRPGAGGTEGADVALSWLLDDEAGARRVARITPARPAGALISSRPTSPSSPTSRPWWPRPCGTLGTPDILVNNAGVYPRVKFLEMRWSDWDYVLDINLKAGCFAAVAVAKALIAAGKRRLDHQPVVTGDARRGARRALQRQQGRRGVDDPGDGA